MPKDLSAWLTKAQAAEALGVSTKTIEKLAEDKVLQKETWRRAGKPAIAVYHPDDVQRERQKRLPDAEPFVVPEDQPHVQGNTELVGKSFAINPEAFLAALVEAEMGPQQIDLPHPVF